MRSIFALFFAALGLSALLWSIVRMQTNDRARHDQLDPAYDPMLQTAVAVTPQPIPVDLLHGAAPCPALAILADRSLDESHRLAVLWDGQLPLPASPGEIAILRRILRDPSEGDTLRNEVANRLRGEGEPSLAADLQQVLTQAGEEPRFRSFAVQHLGMIWSEQLAAEAGAAAAGMQATLVAMLRDPASEVRREALLALARGGDAEGLAEARQLLASAAADDRELREVAIRVLGERGDARALPQVRGFLKDPDPRVRAAAIHAIGACRDQASRAAILAACADPQPLVAAAAQAVLAELDRALDPAAPPSAAALPPGTAP